MYRAPESGVNAGALLAGSLLAGWGQILRRALNAGIALLAVGAVVWLATAGRGYAVWLLAPYYFLNWLADQVFLAMRSLYDSYGLPIVLVAALAEATVGVGAVFPGQVLMFLAGAYSGADPQRLLLVYLVAIVGTATGDTWSYELGRWGGRALEGTRLGASLQIGRVLMSGRARWMIPFYHLHSLTRTVGPFGSGAVRMPLWTWMPLDYLGALISNALWVGAGALFGTAVLTEDGTLKQHPALRISLFVMAMTWFLVMQHLATRRMQELEALEAAREASNEASDAMVG